VGLGFPILSSSRRLLANAGQRRRKPLDPVSRFPPFSREGWKWYRGGPVDVSE
jgi:hypothetical protein